MLNEIPTITGIKPYPKVDVTLTYQNFGSTWLCILRGATQDIDLVFNGLYNFSATNGQYTFHDMDETIAVFWSDEKALKRFFFYKYFFPKSEDLTSPMKGKVIRDAMRFAHEQLQALREHGAEMFMDFSKVYMPQTHAMGQISAERPDMDFKDAVLSYAFKDKSE